MSFLWRIKKFWATIFSHLIQHSWYTFYILCKINANDELEMHFFDDMSGKLLFVRRLSVCKLLTFSSSFPQPTGRFRIILSKTSFGELKELKIACWNDVGLKGEIIMKKTKYVFLLFVPYAIWSHSNRQNVYSFKQLPKMLIFF